MGIAQIKKGLSVEHKRKLNGRCSKQAYHLLNYLLDGNLEKRLTNDLLIKNHPWFTGPRRVGGKVKIIKRGKTVNLEKGTVAIVVNVDNWDKNWRVDIRDLKTKTLFRNVPWYSLEPIGRHTSQAFDWDALDAGRMAAPWVPEQHNEL